MNATPGSAPYSLHRPFSHLYIEREAIELPRARRLIERLPEARVIEIENYRELFNRPRQDWREQKRALKLIVAVKHGEFLHRGSDATPDFGFADFYYTTPVMNCVYDCGYCFLQGLYRSANLVVFANQEDFFRETEKAAHSGSPIYLSISYDSDLLALEHLTGIAAEWIEFSRNHPGLTLEIRTKSANFRALESIPPSANVILAWTLSPRSVAESFEHRAPPLHSRLRSLRAAVVAGWRVRVCIDPILAVDDFEREYGELLDQLAREVDVAALLDVSIGTFRMSRGHFRTLKHSTPTPALLRQQLVPGETMVTLAPERILEIEGAIASKLGQIGIGADRITRAGVPSRAGTR